MFRDADIYGPPDPTCPECGQRLFLRPDKPDEVSWHCGHWKCPATGSRFWTPRTLQKRLAEIEAKPQRYAGEPPRTPESTRRLLDETQSYFDGLTFPERLAGKTLLRKITLYTLVFLAFAAVPLLMMVF